MPGFSYRKSWIVLVGKRGRYVFPVAHINELLLTSPDCRNAVMAYMLYETVALTQHRRGTYMSCKYCTDYCCVGGTAASYIYIAEIRRFGHESIFQAVIALP